jgi:peptidoglycan/xylan/chitin deacetylase (PgdA/CDA1 family)
MNKKALLAKVLSVTGTLSVCRALFTPTNDVLPILAYHRVKPLEDDYPFDKELISAAPEEFFWQMQHVKNYYDPIKLTDLHLFFSGELPWPKRPVIITFDDGFDDNYHHAYPILKKLQVPATLFLATDYIGATETYWFDYTVFLLKQLKQSLTLHTSDKHCSDKGSKTLVLDPQKPFSKQQRDLFLLLKTIPDCERHEVLKQLSAAVNVQPDETGRKHSRPMTWNNVREMIDSGVINIGSHTLSHPALNQLPREQLINELQKSKQKIETETGRPCDILAYPFGGEEITSPLVLEEVKNAGYRYALMYQSNYTLRSSYKNLQLERIHIETDISREQFAAVLALPKIFA